MKAFHVLFWYECQWDSMHRCIIKTKETLLDESGWRNPTLQHYSKKEARETLRTNVKQGKDVSWHLGFVIEKVFFMWNICKLLINYPSSHLNNVSIDMVYRVQLCSWTMALELWLKDLLFCFNPDPKWNIYCNACVSHWFMNLRRCMLDLYCIHTLILVELILVSKPVDTC